MVGQLKLMLRFGNNKDPVENSKKERHMLAVTAHVQLLRKAISQTNEVKFIYAGKIMTVLPENN